MCVLLHERVRTRALEFNTRALIIRLTSKQHVEFWYRPKQGRSSQHNPLYHHPLLRYPLKVTTLRICICFDDVMVSHAAERRGDSWEMGTGFSPRGQWLDQTGFHGDNRLEFFQGSYLCSPTALAVKVWGRPHQWGTETWQMGHDKQEEMCLFLYLSKVMLSYKQQARVAVLHCDYSTACALCPIALMSLSRGWHSKINPFLFKHPRNYVASNVCFL